MTLRTWSLLRLAFVAALLTPIVTAAQTATPSVLYNRFKPFVILPTRTSPVTFEVKVLNSPSQVVIALASGSVVSVLDNGSGVDAVAGDGIFSVALPASDVLYDFAPDDLTRNFVGYLRLFQGGTQVSQSNLLIDVLTSAVPSVNIKQVSPTIQYSEHLVNIVDPAFFPTQSFPTNPQKALSEQAVAKALYARFADVFDFLVLTPEISVPLNAGHAIVQNKAANIGLFVGSSPSGGPAIWGSAGRLLGTTIYRATGMFDGASHNYAHELGHQWVNALSMSPFTLGRGAHWPLSDLASDVMGYAVASNPQGLQFPYDLTPSGANYQMVHNSNPQVFSDLSLYLMGLAPATEVSDHFVFVDQDQTLANGTLLGPVINVSMSAVLAVMGPRIPGYGAAPTKFRVATVLVSRDGLASPEVMQLYDYYSARAEGLSPIPVHVGLSKETSNPFAAATRGRGRLDQRIMHRVLVDASRDGGGWWFPQSAPFNPAAAHQGKLLADSLRADGYIVDELPRPSTITAQLLQPYDIVIRANAFGTYTSTEIAAYQTYVQSGGRLLLLADNATNAPADGVALNFGIQFGGVTRGTNQMTTYVAHPVTTGVATVPYQGTAVLNNSGASLLIGRMPSTSYVDLNNNGVRDASEPAGPSVLGVMGVGKGRLAFSGDLGLWMLVPQPLLRNVVAWLEES